MACYFHYAILSQRSEEQNPSPDSPLNSTQNERAQRMKEDGKKSGSGYAISRLHALATEIPDLTKDLFAYMRTQAFNQRPIIRPWDCNPCDFHIHSSYPNSGTDIQLACPMSLIPPLSTWPSPVAKIQYLLQDSTLKGNKTYSVSQVREDLGLERSVVLDAVQKLIEGNVAVWREGGFEESFGLVMPTDGDVGWTEKGKGKQREGFVVPEVRIFEPDEEEEEGEEEDLYGF